MFEMKLRQLWQRYSRVKAFLILDLRFKSSLILDLESPKL